MVRQSLNIVLEEIASTWRRPKRVLKLFSVRAIKRFLDYQRSRVRSKDLWEPRPGVSAITQRKVASYEDYLELQKSKLRFVDLERHEERFRRVLCERLSRLSFVVRGKTVICLGARLGAEVRAFRDLGLFAVGIDLNPGEKNDAVLYGDFHGLAFPKGSTDIVYSNSLDHAFDLTRIVKEVERVLVPDGRMVIEADPGVDEDQQIQPDIWQTITWKRVDDLVSEIEGSDFVLESREPFEYPRGGQQLVFRKETKSVV